jgi:ABC-type multidrug transport system ATPase subunit
MAEMLVQMQGVTKRFEGATLVSRLLSLGRDTRRPHVALREVSFDLQSREIVGILGGSGSGKSTLLHCVAGLMTPTEGRVLVMGENPAGFTTQVRGRIGWVPALDTSFHPRLTGYENLLFFAELYGVPRARRERLVLDLMGTVGLSTPLDRVVRHYSAGSRLRLSIARALIGEPALLLMDEVTMGLDPRRRDAFYTQVTDLVTARGAGVLLSTRDFTEAQYLCTRVLLLDEGHVAADGQYMMVEAAAEAIFRRHGAEERV